MSVPRHIFNHSIIWLVLPIVVVLALYVSVGRYFFPLLENYRDDIVMWTNERLAINLEIDQLDGQWNDFDPFISFDKIAIYAPDVDSRGLIKPAITVDRFSLELDSLNSFRYQYPMIRQASIEGVTLRLKQGGDESWLLNGWQNQGLSTAAKEKDASSELNRKSLRGRDRLRDDVAPITLLLNFLLRQQHLKMEHVWLELTDRFGREYRAYSRRLEVYEVDGVQRLQGQLQLNPETPQQIEFIMEVKGDPFDQNSLAVDFYLQADSQSLTSWLEKVAHLLPFSSPEVEGGLELWGHWQNGQLHSLKGELENGFLKLALPDLPKIELSDLNTTLFWQRKKVGWELIADNLALKLQGRSFVLNQIAAYKTPDSWSLQVADLDLKTVSETLLDWAELPENARDALERLQPKGTLNNLTVSQNAAEGFLLKTDLDTVSVDAFYGAPVLRGVNGYVESSANAGFIRFNSDEFYMGYPMLYSEGWWFDKAKGQVHWDIGEALRVYGLGLELNRDGAEVAGEFDLTLPKGADDLFYLNVGLTDAEQSFGLRLIPDLIVPKDLTEWLNTSIEHAQVKTGGFIYDGTLNLDSQSPEREISTLLMLDIEQGALKFMPDWPKADQLDARVQLDGTELDVLLHSGRYLGNSGLSGEVDLRDDGTSSVVGLRLMGDLVPEWGWQVFTETPLASLVPESLLQWQLSGAPLHLLTDLHFPVDGRQGEGVVTVDAKDNRVLIPELSTPFENLQSTITYDIDQGLSADKATVNFLGGPARFSIATDLERKSVTVIGEGQAKAEALSRWQPMPFSPWLKGAFDYQFDLELDRVSKLKLTSDLEQIMVGLPKPLGKAKGVVQPLEVDMSFAEQGNQFYVAYGKPETESYLISHGLWGQETEKTGYGVGVWFGNTVPSAKPLDKASNRTDLYIGKSYVEISPWVAFAKQELARQSVVNSVSKFEQNASSSAVVNNSDTVNNGNIDKNGTGNPTDDSGRVRLHLKTDVLAYQDTEINDLTVDAEISGQEVEARFAGQQLEGLVKVGPELVELDMQRVFIKRPESQAESKRSERRELFEQIFLPAWPNANIKVDNFVVFGVSGQKLDVSYRTQRQSRQIKLNNLSQKSINFAGTLDWLVPDEKTRAESSLIFSVKGKDLSDVQNAFDIPVAVASSKAAMGLRLNWLGLPHEVDSKTLSGQVAIELEKGQFEQVQSVSALKLLSLFNFDSLVRRLQLDFSDLSGKGLSYDKVTGKVTLNKGIGVISEPIKVDGTATKFEMTGQIDFISEQFDQEMVVTLPVGETLPFAAVLAGAPQIGGTIYIVQKVFGNLFEKFTRATYTIKGEWDKPKIELKRVF